MKKVKVGIVGFDTSHSHVFPAYIRQHHGKEHPEYLGIEFPVGWPGDPATAVHPENLAETHKKIAELGIRAEEDLDRVVAESDVIFLESVNGGTHLELARRILPAGKPTYIDKPFANSYEDARAIAELIARHRVPCWHSSSLRFEPVMCAAIAEAKGEKLEADVYGPTPLFEKGRGIFYYGIHAAEMVSRIMGRGLKGVRFLEQPDGEIVVGLWEDGRRAVFRGRRSAYAFGGTVHHAKGSVPFQAKGGFYEAFTRELAEFCLTGKAPVPIEDTLEVIAFLEAAERSKAAGGAEVSVSSFA